MTKYGQTLVIFGKPFTVTADRFFVDAKGYNKIMGIPITKTELVEVIKEML